MLASNLQRYRREKGLSQEELAYRADLDRTYVSALERKLYAASVDVLEKLARELEVDPADLLKWPAVTPAPPLSAPLKN